MGKNKKLRKKLTDFVRSLTLNDVREQLVLAYLQMEKCQQVLRGEDVEPVAMKDNGMSSDLELFYLCKKVREELDFSDDNDECDDDGVVSVILEVNLKDVANGR